jgi:hypothetical protein
VLADLFLQKVIPIQVYWEKLRALGIELPLDAELIRLFAESKAFVQETEDPQGARLDAEANGAEDDDEGV